MHLLIPLIWWVRENMADREVFRDYRDGAAT